MANYYVIRIKFHWGFSYLTHYMKHSLLGTRGTISSIITRNFFETRNKQPLTIGTNRMCISIDDCCVNNHVLSTTTLDCKKTLYDDLLSLLSSTCVIRVVLSVSYLLVPYFAMNFVRRIFSECHSFRSMWQSGRMKGLERCFQVEDQGTRSTWRRQNLHAAILRPPAKRIQIKAYERIWRKKDPYGY